MKIKALKFLPLLITCLFFSSAFAQASEDFSDFAELDLEELLNTTVISASKREQKLSEAPNAIFVITAEDIKRSGAVDLPDLFRMVPGVDVINSGGNAYGVSARGFNSVYASKMLVMIDGRSIYTSFYGGVLWLNEEIFLEDIERIEIIRGPGATLWGANAVNGVINIITKDPEEDQGLMITGKVGTKHFRENVTRFSDTLAEKFSYRITGGYREDEGTRGVNDYRRVPKGTGRAKYKLSDDTTLHFFAGVNESEVAWDRSINLPKTDVNLRSNYQMLRLEHQFSHTSQFHLQVSHSYYELHTDHKFNDVEERKNDVEAQHSFTLGEKNHIIWGANYRSSKVDARSLFSGTDHDDLIGFFVQDELTILDNLRFIAGVKYEDNSFTGSDWSPRGSILYSPWPDHHFRFSISRAFSTPTFYGDNGYKPPFLPFLPLPLSRLSFAGNEHLDPEKMTAFELGYRTILFKKMGLNVELYYNELDRVIGLVIPSPLRPFHVTLDNAYDAISKGVEVTVDLPVTSWWTVTANYTFQEVENRDDHKDIYGTPKHKFNLGSSFTFTNGFSLDLKAHYVDETKWFGLDREVTIDDYLRLDVRISQKLLNDKLELSFVGLNLTDKLHPETTDGLGTYEVERLLYGQITFRF
jgi:iron complex outermembrane receptor protein